MKLKTHHDEGVTYNSFPTKPFKYGEELFARAKFKFREFDSLIVNACIDHEPYGSRAPSMEVMGHGYIKKTLNGDHALFLCFENRYTAQMLEKIWSH